MLLWLGSASAAQPAPAAHIGSRACAACHAAQHKAWQASHHAASMQEATTRSVLGDFADARFEQRGNISRFFRRAGKFMVNTEGADGKPADFEIRHTFGVYPLQQYLIAQSGGRLQALGIAWDARPRTAGGQRWFALYPEPPAPGESVHWTSRDQNWNFMCASCHSTGLRKNFDLATNRYATRWKEINVACEACHGPGSRHLAWARGGRRGDNGLSSPLGAMAGVSWRFDTPTQNIARPQGDIRAAKRAEEACYGCHSRRQEINPSIEPGTAFLDNYRPALLDPGLYHADGQNDGEVFEYGAFMQSRMHQAGVTCSNCHQAHSQKLKAEGNALCAQCHRSEHYDRNEHHHHTPGTSGAQCINCHMPQKTYMGVHLRHEHGFRVPRPDLGTASPNVCNTCHADRDNNWASAQLSRWTDDKTPRPAHFSSRLAASRQGDKTALQTSAGHDPADPGIVRATLLGNLKAVSATAGIDQIAKACDDPDPLVRLGAAGALARLPAATAARIGQHLLSDPLRAVRIEAANSLSGVPPTAVSGLPAALDELIAAELASAERPETHVNLGQLLARQGKTGEAERAFLTALRLAPDFSPALLGLAEFYRAHGRDAEGEVLLRRAVGYPGSATASHAFGLWLVRHDRLAEALPWLAGAAESEPGNARFTLTHILALSESGQDERALKALKAALVRHPQEQGLRGMQRTLEIRAARQEERNSTKGQP